MSGETDSIKERYCALLDRYVKAPDESHLAEAAELGHLMMLSGFPIEKIAEFHHEATVNLALRKPQVRFYDLAQTLCVPLIELLMAYSLEFRRTAEERDRMEAALKKAVLEWRRTVDSVEYLILLLDMDGRVIRTNKATRGISRRGSDRLSLLPVETLGTGQPWQSMVDLVRKVQKSRSTASAQVEDESSGKTWDVTATFSSQEKEDDYIVIVARDITEMMKMQQSLRRSEMLSKMGSVLGDFAHEVRNPMFSISATIDAFEARFSHQEQFREYFKVLRGELDRTNKLMKQLLEYGKPSQSEYIECSIADVIEDSVKSCSHKASDARVTIANNAKAKTRPMRLDRVRLSQAFGNILVNAIEYSPPGGSITVDCAEVREGESNWIVCSIKDGGSGFSDEDLSLIFEPFYSKRQGGTGLGLSIVRRVVEDHGGQVSAGNRAGGGAVVTVRLPFNP